MAYTGCYFENRYSPRQSFALVLTTRLT